MDNELNNQTNNAGEDNGSNPSKTKGIINFVIYIAAVLLIVFLVVQFVAIQTKVIGPSMENTLSEDDSIIVDKITYRFNEPERFDIIVFPFVDDDEDETYYFVKRIIALPGETVRIDENGTIYVNGEELEESFGNETISADRLGMAANEITLGEDEYFVLGDNRNNSTDSRNESVGTVNRDEIIGRVWLRLYPFDKFGFVNP